jgi:hypothetical protein
LKMKEMILPLHLPYHPAGPETMLPPGFIPPPIPPASLAPPDYETATKSNAPPDYESAIKSGGQYKYFPSPPHALHPLPGFVGSEQGQVLEAPSVPDPGPGPGPEAEERVLAASGGQELPAPGAPAPGAHAGLEHSSQNNNSRI